MRVMHVPYCFAPDPMGGTEIYVEGLAQALHAHGVESVVTAPAAENAQYEVAKLPVGRFAVSPQLGIEALYGAGDPVAAGNFATLVQHFRPDILHFHSYSSAVSGLVLDVARRAQLPVVSTFHTPAVSCLRGTMLWRGESPCDGYLEAQRCAECMLLGRGAPPVLAKIASQLPVLPEWTGALPVASSWRMALGMRGLAQAHQNSVRNFWAHCDRVVAVAAWVRDLLLRNGVPPQKLVLSRQGIRAPLSAAPAPSVPASGGEEQALRLAFFGRLDATKGLDLPLAALASLPGAPLSIDVFAVRQGQDAERDWRHCKELYGSDPRIRFLEPIPQTEVPRRLRDYSALLVPSRWLETGPLVVYEAFSAHCPVLGTRLGGIAELVRHEEDGLLLEPTVAAWRQVFERLWREPELLPRLRSRIRAPRTMQDGATEMAALYQEVLQERRAA